MLSSWPPCGTDGLTVRMAGRRELVEAGPGPQDWRRQRPRRQGERLFAGAIGPPLRYIANWGTPLQPLARAPRDGMLHTSDTMILGDNKPISSYKPGDRVIGSTGHIGVTQTFSRDFQGDLLKIRGRGMPIPRDARTPYPDRRKKNSAAAKGNTQTSKCGRARLSWPRRLL